MKEMMSNILGKKMSCVGVHNEPDKSCFAMENSQERKFMCVKMFLYHFFYL